MLDQFVWCVPMELYGYSASLLLEPNLVSYRGKHLIEVDPKNVQQFLKPTPMPMR